MRYSNLLYLLDWPKSEKTDKANICNAGAVKELITDGKAIVQTL